MCRYLGPFFTFMISLPLLWLLKKFLGWICLNHRSCCSFTCLHFPLSRLCRPDQVDNPDNLKYIVPDPVVLSGIVVDNTTFLLASGHSIHTPPFVGESYIHDMKELKGEKSATFIPNLPTLVVMKCAYSPNSNIRRANAVPVKIRHVGGETNLKINEGEPAPIQKLFRSLGAFEFKKGMVVTIGTAGTDGKYVIIDSVQFIPLSQLRKLALEEVLPETVTSSGACKGRWPPLRLWRSQGTGPCILGRLSF